MHNHLGVGGKGYQQGFPPCCPGCLDKPLKYMPVPQMDAIKVAYGNESSPEFGRNACCAADYLHKLSAILMAVRETHTTTTTIIEDHFFLTMLGPSV
jgi:hypothetical protein